MVPRNRIQHRVGKDGGEQAEERRSLLWEKPWRGMILKTKGRVCCLLLEKAQEIAGVDNIRENRANPLLCLPCSLWTWTGTLPLAPPLPRLEGKHPEVESALALEIEAVTE